MGVLNDEDTASRLSESVSSPIPAEPGSRTPSKAGKRPLKLRNKVYFQLLEATNALQREEAEKAGGKGQTVKLNSAQTARLAQIALDTQLQDEKAVETSRKQLSEFVPLMSQCVESRFVQYITQIQSILRQNMWSVCIKQVNTNEHPHSHQRNHRGPARIAIRYREKANIPNRIAQTERREGKSIETNSFDTRRRARN